MKVKFLPQDISVSADSNKSVMELAKENQLTISSSCNGMCSCAECRVYVVEGEAHVLPPSVRETELIGGAHFVDSRRLSCQLFCFGDVTVDLSEQLERKSNKRQQFLQPKNSFGEKSSALGDILVQQDQDMNKLSQEGDRSSHTNKSAFYRSSQKENHKRERGIKESPRRERGNRNFAFKNRGNHSLKRSGPARHRSKVRKANTGWHKG